MSDEPTERVTVRCGRCGGDGSLNPSGNATDHLRCPDCRGEGTVQKDVSELPRSYCPWCDAERPKDGEICVRCENNA